MKELEINWKSSKLMASRVLSQKSSKALKEMLGGLSCLHLPMLMVFLMSSVLAQISKAFILNTTQMSSSGWFAPGDA